MARQSFIGGKFWLFSTQNKVQLITVGVGGCILVVVGVCVGVCVSVCVGVCVGVCCIYSSSKSNSPTNM